MATTKTPAQRTATPAPALTLELEATKETPGTVRYDVTEQSAKANGGRGTNIYIPKSMIPAGGLRPKIRIEVHLIEE